MLQHSSIIRGFRSMKCSSKTLQNLLHFMHNKTHVVFFSFFINFMNALDIHQERSKVAWNEKWKKKLCVFSYTKKYIANFEVFRWNILLSVNLLFLHNGFWKKFNKSKNGRHLFSMHEDSIFNHHLC